jgi:HSP20 family protein
MSWDEDTDRWMRRWRRMPFFGREAFDDLDRMFDDLFKEMLNNVPQDLYRERSLPGGGTVREIGPFVYGYSMTLGPDGKPVIREFGNVKPSTKPSPLGFRRPSLEIKEERDPLVDVIPEDGKIRVVAEVPGVERSDIKLNCSEKALTIAVDAEERKYHKEIDLPAEVDPTATKATYKNGVLEIILTKVTEKKPTGESIRID